MEGLEDGERELQDSADYDRVVLWFEHDVTDQLSLIHLLGHYARHRRPPRLELVSIGDFPGAGRFTGLGELPPEALRMLWKTRKPVSAVQLQSGLDAWRALANPDPRPLAAIMRSDTPALPLLARALHRHLCELPSAVNGLSLTEELALTLMAEPLPDWHGAVNLERSIGPCIETPIHFPARATFTSGIACSIWKARAHAFSSAAPASDPASRNRHGRTC